MYGYINIENQSDVLLCISYFNKDNRSIIYRYLILVFDDEKISKMEVYEPQDLVAKKLNNIAISYIRNQTYDDMNEEIVNNIKNNTMTYQELLELAFPSRGTRTNMRNIRK